MVKQMLNVYQYLFKFLTKNVSCEQFCVLDSQNSIADWLLNMYFCDVNFVQRLFTFYISSSIHVAIAVCVLVWITTIQLHAVSDATLSYFVFFATISGYNFTKYAPIARMQHKSLSSTLKVIQLFSLICFLATCYFGFQLSLKLLLVTIFLGMLNLAYVVPVFSGHKTLRTLPGLKIMVIAICWAGVTVVLPVLDLDMQINSTVVLLILQRLLFVLAITIPFEIRDLSYDSFSLRTIPQQIGVSGAKWFGVFLVIGSGSLMFFKGTLSSSEISSTILMVLITVFFILRTKKEQSRYFCSFWVEGIPMFWWGILVLWTQLF